MDEIFRVYLRWGILQVEKGKDVCRESAFNGKKGLKKGSNLFFPIFSSGGHNGQNEIMNE
jgi:hypothetical protein